MQHHLRIVNLDRSNESLARHRLQCADPTSRWLRRSQYWMVTDRIDEFD